MSRLPPSSNSLIGKAFVDAQHWRDLINASAATPEMKRRIISFADVAVICGRSLVDCFLLGFALGNMEVQISSVAEHRDFLIAIEATRDKNKLPIVKMDDQPVH